MSALVAALAIMLATTASGARAATPQATDAITMMATVLDPSLGTTNRTAIVSSIWYASAQPERWKVTTPDGDITGTLQRARYRGVAPGRGQLDVTYIRWTPTRLFADGFGP